MTAVDGVQDPSRKRLPPANLHAVIRIAVLDDHPAVLAGLERLVQRAEDMEPVAFVEMQERLWEKLDRCSVDVVVVDYDLARGDGLAVCLRLKERARPPGVIVYSAYAGPGLAIGAQIAGADGVVSKSESVSALLTAIRTVASGEKVLPPIAPDLQHAAMSRLHDADVAVAAMLLAGTSHHDVAGALGVERREVARRARRIVAGLRPAPSAHDDEADDASAWAGAPERVA
jgi:DNA-binding NarL/FixJ family response regulator